jgi:hypothetical protein
MAEQRQDVGRTGRVTRGSTPRRAEHSLCAECGARAAVHTYRDRTWIVVCPEHRRVSFLPLRWAVQGEGRFTVAPPDGPWEGDIEAPLAYDPPRLSCALDRIWSLVVPSGWPLMVFVRLRSAIRALPRAWGDPWPLWAEHQAVLTTGCTLEELRAMHTRGPLPPLFAVLTPGSKEHLRDMVQRRHEALGIPLGAHPAGYRASPHRTGDGLLLSGGNGAGALMPAGKFEGWPCGQIPDRYLVEMSKRSDLRPSTLNVIWQELHFRFPDYYPPPPPVEG